MSSLPYNNGPPMKARDLNEVEYLAMRRLVFQLARTATSREELDRFLSDLQLLIPFPRTYKVMQQTHSIICKLAGGFYYQQ
eukprot:scaffold41334_cov146-Skeletonema_marinoi.AAC.2